MDLQEYALGIEKGQAARRRAAKAIRDEVSQAVREHGPVPHVSAVRADVDAFLDALAVWIHTGSKRDADALRQNACRVVAVWKSAATARGYSLPRRAPC